MATARDSATSTVARGERLAGSLLVAATLFAVTLVAILTGRSFWDDEIFAIRLLQAARGSPATIVALANSHDVHPPLGYLLTEAVHWLTGDWQATKAVGGLLNAMALGLLAWCAASTLPRKAWWLAVLLLAGAASAIMWGASLRWYAWFQPLYWAMFAVLGFGRPSVRQAAIVLAVSGAILFEINYLAILAVPLLGIYAAWRLRARLTRRNAIEASAILALGLAACIPQLLVLLQVHLPYQVGLDASLSLRAALQIAMTLALGNAVLPFNWLPLAWLGVVVAGAVWAIARGRVSPWLWPMLAMLAGGAVLVFAAGLGDHPRNAMILYPVAILAIAGILTELPAGWRILACVIGLLYQAQGLANVAWHHDTTKNSYNMPYAQVLQAVDRIARHCRTTVVVHHDVVLTWHLEQRRLGQISYYHDHDDSFFFNPTSFHYDLRPGDCVIGLDSYAGAVPPQDVARLAKLVEGPRLHPARRWNFGQERGTGPTSRIMGEPLPSSAVVLTEYRVTGPMRLVSQTAKRQDSAIR